LDGGTLKDRATLTSFSPIWTCISYRRPRRDDF
jgi:hypothetical protein